MEGMEVLRKLRERHDETPVVVITAHGNVPDAVEAMKLGAIDFLSKPLSPDALRHVVDEMISRHAAPGAVAPEDPEGLVPSGSTAVVIGPMVLDLTAAKRALNLRKFDRAAELLEEALDHDPHSVEANTLLGVLYESRGQNHAAYHAYKTALTVDPRFGPALENMTRYCKKHGLDVHNRAINPAAN
jgi:DNA-binding response OmpR family regulator